MSPFVTFGFSKVHFISRSCNTCVSCNTSDVMHNPQTSEEIVLSDSGRVSILICARNAVTQWSHLKKMTLVDPPRPMRGCKIFVVQILLYEYIYLAFHCGCLVVSLGQLGRWWFSPGCTGGTFSDRSGMEGLFL